MTDQAGHVADPKDALGEAEGAVASLSPPAYGIPYGACVCGCVCGCA